MSFSKAKRFNNKPPEVYGSPADYLLHVGFEKGCSIPRCPRFRYSQNEEEQSVVCPKLSHSSCRQNNEDQRSCVHDKKVQNRTFSEFDRNDPRRKSLRTSKNNRQTRSRSFTPYSSHKNTLKGNLSKSEEFIEDDFGYLTCEELEHNKNLEEYELNEVCNILERIKEKRLARAANIENESFKDLVLKRLKSLDMNIKTIKDDMNLSQNKGFVNQVHCQNAVNLPNRNPQDIRDLIMKTMQKLKKNIEKKRRMMLRDDQDHIIDVLDEMRTTSDKAGAQMKQMCNATAEELIANLDKVIQTSTCNFDLENNIEVLLEEFINLELNDSDSESHELNTEPLDNLIFDYFEQTYEVGEDLEDDLCEITMRCEDTQLMLQFQGVLLDEMKCEIQNLKFNYTQEQSMNEN